MSVSGDERDELLRLVAEDTSYADLRQNIEFMRAAVREALDTVEVETACRCHEISAHPPRACRRCKAIDRIRAEIEQVT